MNLQMTGIGQPLTSPPATGKWGVPKRTYWRWPAIWVAGALGAVAHHLVNAHYHNTRIDEDDSIQGVLSAFGIALSMFVKFCFTWVLYHAFLQSVWKVVRQHKFRVRTLDDLFGAADSPQWAWNWELLKEARMSAVLAGIIWIFKLLTIAPPTTLTVLPSGALETTMETAAVRNISFFPRDGRNVDEYLNLIYFDSSLINRTIGNYPRLDPLLQNIAVSSAYLGKPILPESPCGLDCSYEIEFEAPLYKCEDVELADTPWGSERVLLSTWNESDSSAYKGRRVIYIAEENKGTFWFASQYLRDGIRNVTSIKEKDRDSDAAFKVTDDDYIRSSFKCTDWYGAYRVALSFASRVASIQVIEKSFWYEEIHEGEDRTVSGPNPPMHGLMKSWLEGNITLRTGRFGNAPTIPASLIIGSTKLVDTNLPFGDAEAGYYYPVPDLRRAVEGLYQNITLSMLSASPLFYFIYEEQDHPVLVTRPVGLFVYRPAWLISVYAVAAGITLTGHFVGLHAIRFNGVEGGDGFSTFAAVTRNREIDDLADGNSLGAKPLDRKMLDATLKFGIINQTGSLVRFAFGKTAEPFQKGTNYQ